MGAVILSDKPEQTETTFTSLCMYETERDGEKRRSRPTLIDYTAIDSDPEKTGTLLPLD